MIAFSVKCNTAQQSYSFARLAMRLGVKWSNDGIFTANNNRWKEFKEKTHYNVNITDGIPSITYGFKDDTIWYELLPSDQFESILNWGDVESIISE